MSLTPTPEQIEQSYPGYDELIERYINLYGMDYEKVCKLEDDFINYRNFYLKISGIIFCMGSAGPYSEDLKTISEHKKNLLIRKSPHAKKFYDLIVHMSTDDDVNEYKLYDVHDSTLMDYESFKDLWEKWQKSELSPEIEDDEFIEWLHDNCCSDWAKMDRYGEPYGGYWRYPEGSDEKENAYDLSKEYNFKGLCELPYPREIIKWTIAVGCNNRIESVRYSNFLCEWIKRKQNRFMVADLLH